MRIITTDKEEKKIRCPECKTLLAYTEDDVRLATQFGVQIGSNKICRVAHYVDCPICGYGNLMDYKEINYD